MNIAVSEVQDLRKSNTNLSEEFRRICTRLFHCLRVVPKFKAYFLKCDVNCVLEL